MKRPERNQNSKSEQQQRENKILRVRRQRMRRDVFREFRNIKRVRAGFQIKRDEADERAEAQIQRDLERRVIFPFTASPNADHYERRDQREFVERVEKKQIQRRE